MFALLEIDALQRRTTFHAVYPSLAAVVFVHH
jgi:hypothetical protein